MASSFEQFQFLDEEGRQEIYKWSQNRQRKYKGFGRFVYLMKIFAFDKSLLKSFVHNVNVIVLIQMILAGTITYLCSYANIYFDVHVTLFVSPLVFPLAFSINTDFQRREKVLEDLANFKASTMVWFFCVRDWRIPGMFDEAFMKAVSSKTKGLMFHLREYLLTEKAHQREFILQVLYEDLSDVAQINEKIRTSKLDAISPIAARIIHLHYLMCLSFERLRVIREYRSPRSIRSFTKIFIFALPLLLAPYYVHLGRTVRNSWSPYFIAVLVAFLFGALQGVQDKLDDPFDGMSEDDINLGTLDEWTIQSLEATANRTIKVGRFTVSVSNQGNVEFSAAHPPATAVRRDESFGVNKAHAQKRLGLLPWQRQLSQLYSEEEISPESEEFKDMHPYTKMLSNLPGNATIVRGGHVKEKINLDDLLQGSSGQNTVNNPIFDQGFFQTPTSTVQRTVEAQKSVVPFQRNFSQEPPESKRMVAHPGIGAASYINSMNKDRRRKSSAPVLCTPFEAAVVGNVDTGSISSDDSIGLVLRDSYREGASSPNLPAIFQFEKATPVNLDPMSPTIRSEYTGSSYVLMNEAVDEKPSLKNRKLRQTKSAENDINIEPQQQKSSERRFDVEMKDLNSKSNPLKDKNETKETDNDMLIERESPDLVPAKEQRAATNRRFAVTKTGSKSRLLVESPENGSSDSLSRVVGKLKDKEVFL